MFTHSCRLAMTLSSRQPMRTPNTCSCTPPGHDMAAYARTNRGLPERGLPQCGTEAATRDCNKLFGRESTASGCHRLTSSPRHPQHQPRMAALHQQHLTSLAVMVLLVVASTKPASPERECLCVNATWPKKGVWPRLSLTVLTTESNTPVAVRALITHFGRDGQPTPS